MEILINGMAGFIGFHLANKLITRGVEVVGLDSINDYYDVRVKYGRLDYTGVAQSDIAYNTLVQKIVCGGGQINKYIDPEGLLLNISTLDDKGCSDLVRTGNACLLPVKNNRISPGSPLKLYDYIAKKKYVLTQSDLLGYSDEVEKYGFESVVDFKNSSEVANFFVELTQIKLKALP